jgi:hypothetical protein
MGAFREEAFEVRPHVRGCVRRRNTDRVEAMLACGGGERRLQRTRIAQKSRSA